MSFDRGLIEMMQQQYQEQEKAQAEQAAAAQEAREREARELETRREERLTREAYQGLTEGERAEFDRLAAPVNVVRELSQQALNQAVEKFNADNAAQRQRELDEMRRKPYIDRAAEIQKINRRADERAAAFKKALEDRELQAEKHDDEITRLISALPVEALPFLTASLNSRPKPIDIIQGIRQGSAQAGHRARQSELRRQYEAELPKAGHSPEAVRKLRAQYRELGLEI